MEESGTSLLLRKSNDKERNKTIPLRKAASLTTQLPKKPSRVHRCHSLGALRKLKAVAPFSWFSTLLKIVTVEVLCDYPPKNGILKSRYHGSFV